MKYRIKHTLTIMLIATTMLIVKSRAAVLITMTDAGGGMSNMTISASGIINPVPAGINGSYFTYDTPTPTFHGTAAYENITIPPISTGSGSDPFSRLRIRDDFDVGSRFQLWTGSSDTPVDSPFDLSAMNGTYVVPVDFALLNEGSWNLDYAAGIDVGDVTLTVVPEPSSILCLGFASLALVALRRRSKC